MIREHETVVLTRDVPEHDLRAGDVGAVVHSYANGTTYEVEFVTGNGATVAVLTLDDQSIRTIGAVDILHVRGMSSTGNR